MSTYRPSTWGPRDRRNAWPPEKNSRTYPAFRKMQEWLRTNADIFVPSKLHDEGSGL